METNRASCHIKNMREENTNIIKPQLNLFAQCDNFAYLSMQKKKKKKNTVNALSGFI